MIVETAALIDAEVVVTAILIAVGDGMIPAIAEAEKIPDSAAVMVRGAVVGAVGEFTLRCAQTGRCYTSQWFSCQSTTSAEEGHLQVQNIWRCQVPMLASGPGGVRQRCIWNASTRTFFLSRGDSACLRLVLSPLCCSSHCLG